MLYTRGFRGGDEHTVDSLELYGSMDDNNASIGMNPLDYWVGRNKEVSKFVEQYEQNEYIAIPKMVSKKLIEDMKELFKTGNVYEKTMVLAVLAAAKLYFGENEDGESFA